jgi:general secretion pathway protein D
MKFVRTLLVSLVVLSSLYGASEDTIKLNIRDMSVRQFVETIGKITKKNILINGKLNGTINFISNTPIKRSSLFSLANSILSSKGYALVDHGDFMEVVKASEAASMGLAVDDEIGGETMKTVVFSLKNTNASIIRAKIRPLLHRNAKVVSFKENNMIAITDYPKTLKSVKKLIDTIEQSGNKGSTIIVLKYADVKDVYPNALNMAKQLFPENIPSEKVTLLKDESTNSIILVGKKENVHRMLQYVKQLDRQGDSVSQRMYVIPLKNSNVEEMEKILSKLIVQMNNISSMGGKAGKSGAVQKKAMVVGDSERNALIVLATGEQIRNIRDVVSRIDVEKPQVYIKARIVEINSELAQQIGAKYGFEAGAITSNGLFTAAGNFGAKSLMISPSIMSFLDTTKTYYDENGNPIQDEDSAFKFANDISQLFAIGAKIDLLQEDGAAHVLSEPSILCTNNQESELYVGETRSILTSSSMGDNKDDLIRNNWSREDIGLTLKVKPRLSSHNKVVLNIDAVIEDVVPGTGANNPRPTTTKRKVATNAIVRNGQTVILGGLIKNVAGTVNSKVPFFGDIPVIGRIFQDEGKAQRKVDLVIYLTPYIVKKSSDLEKLRVFLSELESVQKRYTDFVKSHLKEGDVGYDREPGSDLDESAVHKKSSVSASPSSGKSATPPPSSGSVRRGSSPMDILNTRPGE